MLQPRGGPTWLRAFYAKTKILERLLATNPLLCKIWINYRYHYCSCNIPLSFKTFSLLTEATLIQVQFKMFRTTENKEIFSLAVRIQVVIAILRTFKEDWNRGNHVRTPVEKQENSLRLHTRSTVMYILKLLNRFSTKEENCF